jgi:imidazolonepropionase
MRYLFHNAAQLVGVTSPRTQRRRGSEMRDIRVINDGSLIVDDGIIEWVGPTSALPEFDTLHVIDASGKVLLPGLIDSHTHLIFAGSRAGEFEQRISGATYQEITAAGGGILSTVREVRGRSREELAALARPRLRRLLQQGVTTVEVKTGYGLTPADEMKCLEAIADLAAEGPLELVPTFLGAHAVPPEFAANRNGYVHLLCDEMLPEVARSRLAAFCDVFCETGVFDLSESQRILDRALEVGLGVKVHADELTPLGGAELAVRLGAASADHLLCVSDTGIASLAASETIATLLPGTAFFLGLDYAPARRLIDEGAAVALASDCNPGTCMTENLPLVGSMACTQMRMLPSEVVTALTLNAAAALRLGDRLGSLASGKQADLVLYNVADYRELLYHFGVNHVHSVWKRGQLVYPTSGERGHQLPDTAKL